MELAQFNTLVQQFVSTVPGLQLSGCATVDTLGRPRVYSASIAVVGQSSWPQPATEHLAAATALALQVQIEGFYPIACSCIRALHGENEILRWQVQFEANLRAQAEHQLQSLSTERASGCHARSKKSTKWPVMALVGEHGWVQVRSWNPNGIYTDSGSFFTRALVKGIRIFGDRDTYYAKGLDQTSRYLLSVKYTISAIRSIGKKVIDRLRKKAKTFVYGGSFISAGVKENKPLIPPTVRSFIDRVGNLATEFKKDWYRTTMQDNLPPKKQLPCRTNKDRTLEKADIDYCPSDDEEAHELVRKDWFFYKTRHSSVASAVDAIRAGNEDTPARLLRNFGSKHTRERDEDIYFLKADEGRFDESDCASTTDEEREPSDFEEEFHDAKGYMASEDLSLKIKARYQEPQVTEFQQRVWELKTKHEMRTAELELQLKKHELALQKSEAELAREELIRKRLCAPRRIIPM